jgi:para-aminobenzoate synthetase/4-amino-4-deoxychorismate lyase
MRLTLEADGGCNIQAAPLAPMPAPVSLMLCAGRMRSDELFLRHKTTLRTAYDAAWRIAEQHGAFDMLFFNERGELTEGGRCNVFVRREGRWSTPPLAAGVLPGVMRAVMLADPAWNACERTLMRDDLRQAEAVVVCNALRGALAAEIVWDGGK